MPIDERTQEQFLKELALTDFAQRYYRLYESFRNHKDFTKWLQVDINSVVKTLPVTMMYKKRESVYVYQEGGLDLRFTAKVSVDFVFSYALPQGVIGGPFTLLAYESALLKEPTFTYTPLAPKIPFASADDLQEILKQGLYLCNIAKEAVLSCSDKN